MKIIKENEVNLGRADNGLSNEAITILREFTSLYGLRMDISGNCIIESSPSTGASIDDLRSICRKIKHYYEDEILVFVNIVGKSQGRDFRNMILG